MALLTYKRNINKINLIKFIIFFGLLVIFIQICYFRSAHSDENDFYDVDFNISELISEHIFRINSNKHNTTTIYMYNLTKPLEPAGLFRSIKCRKSLEVYVKTRLCVHDVSKDKHVSGSIWRKYFLKYFLY